MPDDNTIENSTREVTDNETDESNVSLEESGEDFPYFLDIF